MLRFLLPLLVLITVPLWSAESNLEPLIASETAWERGETVVLAGDQHSQQGTINWLTQLSRAMDSKRAELGVSFSLRGVGRGKHLESVANDLATNSKPNLVFINVGLFELTAEKAEKPGKPATREEYEATLTAAVRRLTQEGILVVLATPIPPEKRSGGAEKDPILAGYAEAVRAVATSNDIEVADFRAVIAPLGAGVIGDLGINQAGQNALATEAARAIAATLDKAPMKIEISGGEYVGTVTVPITVRRVRNPEKIEIRYSLTGKEPHPKNGTLYKRPLKISSSCTLIAIATNPANGTTARAEVRFEKAKVLPAERPSKRVNGLAYEFYRGQFKDCQDFQIRAGEPTAKGVALGPDIQAVIEDESNPEPLPVVNDFGLIFTGYVDVPSEGVYNFFSRSCDGSRVFIHDQLVVDNDGLHGPTEKSGHVALAEGTHSIRVEFIKGASPLKAFLEVSIDGPNMRKIRLPDMILCRDANPKPRPKVEESKKDDKAAKKDDKLPKKDDKKK